MRLWVEFEAFRAANILVKFWLYIEGIDNCVYVAWKTIDDGVCLEIVAACSMVKGKAKKSLKCGKKECAIVDGHPAKYVQGRSHEIAHK